MPLLEGFYVRQFEYKLIDTWFWWQIWRMAYVGLQDIEEIANSGNHIEAN